MENSKVQPSYFINRFGVTVTVKNPDGEQCSKAFITPLKRQNVMYLSDEHKKLLKEAELKKYQLYICPANIQITKSSVIQYLTEEYSVVVTEPQIINKKPVYIWAVLAPKNTQNQE